MAHPKIYLGVGSSIGNAVTHFNKAETDMFKRGIKVTQKSKKLTNKPQGGVAQNQFTNAVWRVEFPETNWEKINWILLPSWRRQKLKAYQLLKKLQQVEALAHRVREKRWDDRTLDLDILMFGDLILEKQRLLIPHPRIRERSFVLLPWQELVDKNFEIPKFGSIGALIKSLKP